MNDINRKDYTNPAEGELGEELLIKLSRLVWHYKKAFNLSNNVFDLSPNELGLMMIMYQYPEINTANQIVKELGTTKGLASRNVDSLVQKGLIKTAKDEKDKRVIRLSLCDKAKDICHLARLQQQAFYSKAMEGIDKADARLALSVVEKMVDNIL